MFSAAVGGGCTWLAAFAVTHTAGELVRLVGDRLGLVFTGRDSDYRGVHHLAGISNGRIEIQPNPIPGDDDEDDLYAPEHPAAQVLLLTTTPTRTPPRRLAWTPSKGSPTWTRRQREQPLVHSF